MRHLRTGAACASQWQSSSAADDVLPAESAAVLPVLAAPVDEVRNAMTRGAQAASRKVADAWRWKVLGGSTDRHLPPYLDSGWSRPYSSSFCSDGPDEAVGHSRWPTAYARTPIEAQCRCAGTGKPRDRRGVYGALCRASERQPDGPWSNGRHRMPSSANCKPLQPVDQILAVRETRNDSGASQP